MIESLLVSLGANGLTSGIAKALEKNLGKKLKATMDAWAQADSARSIGDVFFPTGGVTDRLPEMAAVVKAIEEPRIPSVEEWHLAFLARWRQVRTSGKEVHPFFGTSESIASEHLKSLAQAVNRVCREEEKLFRSSVIDNQEIIIDQNVETHRRLDNIEKKLDEQYNIDPSARTLSTDKNESLFDDEVIEPSGESGRLDPKCFEKVRKNIEKILGYPGWDRYYGDIAEAFDEPPDQLTALALSQLLTNEALDDAVSAIGVALRDEKYVEEESRKRLWAEAGEILEWLLILEVDSAFVQVIEKHIRARKGIYVRVRTELGLDILHSRAVGHKANLNFKAGVRSAGGKYAINLAGEVDFNEDWTQSCFVTAAKKRLFSLLAPKNNPVPETFREEDNRKLTKYLKMMRKGKRGRYLVLPAPDSFEGSIYQDIKVLLEDIPELRAFFLCGEDAKSGALITYEEELEPILQTFFDYRKESIGS